MTLTGFILAFWGLAAAAPVKPAASAVCARAGLACPGWASFRVDQSAEQRGSALGFLQARLSLAGRTARLETVSNVDAARAARMTQRRLTMIDKLSQPFAVGHVGLPRWSEKPARGPEFLTAPDGRTALLIPASDELTYDPAAGEKAPLRAVVSFLYCSDSRAWIESELFIPGKAFDRVRDLALAFGARCR